MGRHAVSSPVQLGLDCCMPLSPVSTLRTRLSLAVLNLIARLAYRRPRGSLGGEGQNESVARILVLELWNIGDVILAMPFLAQLRCLFPRAKITLLSQPFAVDLLAGTGFVDEFITADLIWTPADRPGLARKTIDLWRVSRKLRQQKFDVAFSSRLHIRERVLLAFSGAKRRVGFALGERDGALTDAIAVGDAQLHKVEDWMRLLEPFGGAAAVHAPRLYLEDSERSWSNGYLASRGVAKDDLLVGIHPGASLAEKRWPLERFSEVATATAAQPGVRVLAFAEPSGYGSELFAIPGVVGAQVTLRQMMALIERCGLLVCNDSGPMHIAGALGVPTVAMFGAGIEQWFAPLGEGHEMLRPDQDEPLSDSGSPREGVRAPKGIGTAQVLEAVGRAVQRLRTRGTFSRVGRDDNPGPPHHRL
jgi:heptosyltransferase-2